MERGGRIRRFFSVAPSGAGALQYARDLQTRMRAARVDPAITLRQD